MCAKWLYRTQRVRRTQHVVKARRRWWPIIAISLTLAACASDTTPQTQPTFPSASSLAEPSTTRSQSLTAIAPDQVATALSDVTGATPLLLPTLIPVDYTADVNTHPQSFQVTYRSPSREQVIALAILVPNQALPTDHTTQSFPNFRGDPRSLYQVDDTTNPDTVRSLEWTEPGHWSLENRGGVPYFLTATGITDEEFWRYADSIQPIST